jgi:glutathione S-transferase
MLFPYVPRKFVRVTVTLPERDSYDALSRLEHQLESRQYLAGGYTLADIARAGNFHRLREIAESGDVPLHKYPNVMSWMERIEGRESYKVFV